MPLKTVSPDSRFTANRLRINNFAGTDRRILDNTQENRVSIDMTMGFGWPPSSSSRMLKKHGESEIPDETISFFQTGNTSNEYNALRIGLFLSGKYRHATGYFLKNYEAP